MSTRNRTSSNIIGYGLYLYFLGLSFRNTDKALSFLLLVKISHVSIWNWMQKYRPWKHLKKKKINRYIIDETVIKAGSELIWLWWIVIDSKHKEILLLIYLKKNYVCCRTSSFYSYKQVWKTSSLIRRWCHLVSRSLQIIEPTSSTSLLFWKKYYWKNNAVHKG